MFIYNFFIHRSSLFWNSIQVRQAEGRGRIVQLSFSQLWEPIELQVERIVT